MGFIWNGHPNILATKLKHEWEATGGYRMLYNHLKSCDLHFIISLCSFCSGPWLFPTWCGPTLICSWNAFWDPPVDFTGSGYVGLVVKKIKEDRSREGCVLTNSCSVTNLKFHWGSLLIWNHRVRTFQIATFNTSRIMHDSSAHGSAVTTETVKAMQIQRRVILFDLWMVARRGSLITL